MAILDGKNVIAPQKEILEVRNAIKTYELYPTLNPFSIEDMLKAHHTMMSGLVDEAGMFRRRGVGVFDGTTAVHIAPPAERVKDLMNDLFIWLENSEDHLLIRSCVFHYEFEFIHPFADGNGRVSRLLSLFLLYKSGYDVGKYVSFEEKINESKEYYYSALHDSSVGWHTNENTYFEFMKNFLSTLYRCYKELDKRFSTVNGKRLSKTERIEQTVLNSVLPISKSEICEILQDVSPTTVESVLGKMVKTGSVMKLGQARATKYVNAKYIKKNS